MNLIEDFSKPLGEPVDRGEFAEIVVTHIKEDFDWAEFGVYTGGTAKFWLEHLPIDKKIYLFDSFEGLPEEWADSKRILVSPVGTFAKDVDGIAIGDSHREYNGTPVMIDPPDFNDSRAVLQIGWFEDTVPIFVENYKEESLSFIHIDSDLYSSAKLVLNELKDLITPETVIVFDELCGTLRQQEHEYKAFEEFVLENKLTPEYICSNGNHRVALRLN